MHVGVGVIAVVGACDKAFGWFARGLGRAWVAVTVPIGIHVEVGVHGVVVRRAVAVVVPAVAPLRGPGECGRVGGGAVSFRLRHPVAVQVLEGLPSGLKVLGGEEAAGQRRDQQRGVQCVEGASVELHGVVTLSAGEC